MISLSHTDLDGASAQIVIYQTFGEINTLNCGYGKVGEYLDIIEDMMRHHTGNDRVFITDLHFEEKFMVQLQRLATMFPLGNFVYIDHHDYEYDPKTYALPNLKIIVSNQYSATKLTYGYLKKNGGLQPTPELTRFVNIVDAYDLWRTEDPHFMEGMKYNDIFWDYFARAFYVRFKDIHAFRSSDKELSAKMDTKRVKLFKKLQETGKIFGYPNKCMLIAFLNEHRSYMTVDFHGYLSYVNTTTFGSISIRLDNRVPKETAKYIKDTLVSWVTSRDDVISAGGHVHAFGITIHEKYKEPEYVNDLVKITQEIAVKLDHIMEVDCGLYQEHGDIEILSA